MVIGSCVAAYYGNLSDARTRVKSSALRAKSLLVLGGAGRGRAGEGAAGGGAEGERQIIYAYNLIFA